MRMNVSLGALGVDGWALDHGDLPPHTHLDAGPLWGIPLELGLGYAFGDPRDVRPYLEVRSGVTVLRSEIAAIADAPMGS